MTTIEEIRDNFDLLDEWDDRYRYVIELGKTLAPMSEAQHSPENKVRGCASQVWLDVKTEGSDDPVLTIVGDSDAHIVRGLIAILLSMMSGKRASEILATDALKTFDELGLRAHLTPQRSNGLHAMVERIRADAKRAQVMVS